ncbi:unnamed protein product [Rhizophagus irregularis]|nr:unnamed protein product [Rhizophagus irregularis]
MSMSDIESMSNDCSDSDLFTEEFLENIPDGCDLSDNEVCFDNTAETYTNLTLELLYCNNKGHNHATCPSNLCQKRKKNERIKVLIEFCINLGLWV